MNLMTAHHQWRDRPADERYESLKQMLHAAEQRQRISQRRTHLTTNIAVVEEGEELGLVATNGDSATMSHWTFGQMCQRLRVPADYLRDRLPAHMGAELLNYHIRTLPEPEEWSLHTLENGVNIARAITSPTYTTIWDSDIISRCIDLQEQGWRVPPARPASPSQPGARPATADDVLDDRWGLSVKIGDIIAPAGLYMGDRDMFVFMVNEQRRITDRLSRGCFLQNSEVRGGSWVLTAFFYDHVCGNHIVWGASRVKEVRVRHTGWADDRAFDEMRTELHNYSDKGAEEERQLVINARNRSLGKDKAEVLDRLFRLRKPALTQERCSLAYDVAERTEPDVSPRSVWGMVCGLTRVSQGSKWQDARDEIDRAAGAVLALAK